jgi:hypothetical protein
MKVKIFGCLVLWLVGPCFGQEVKSLCPRHIEPPFYPHIAATAHVYGKFVLSVTIDADGNVQDAEATNDGKWVALLKLSTISNIRHWTFTNPPFAPFKQTIVYDYKIDDSFPLDGPTIVSFDLPDRVTIVTSGVSVQTTVTGEKLNPMITDSYLSLRLLVRRGFLDIYP